MQCGFQLLVSGSSSANAKYIRKRLHGKQFFDTNLFLERAGCPFYINVSGGSGAWQLTKAKFAHNYLKNVGFSAKSFAESSIPRPAKALRNTTQQT
ncbi:hypothetical protein PC110_g15298 [Phytophthora cactorum]|uniref:Uncharacterized protein n=1 Tax=Phytophthora cactorum TaxID=29920 RepID=A0A329RUS5_9STRA|nr:hypothetical protein PC112_g10909 [Phytophthora cactorum]KAG2825018.1 hypothetical protein PC111_g9569 [Phytophthora cactorum]KAG2919422.1 hypothetical protein PC115_g10133 [Phytophthora cactorum]RAW28311.1 hypothetical protein PC110_g15298 [Phytophthora cactorum]